MNKTGCVVSACGLLLLALFTTQVYAQVRFIDRAHTTPADSIQAQKEAIQQSIARGNFRIAHGSKPKKRGPPVDPAQLVLPHWTSSFRSEGVDYPFTVIGGNPAAGQTTVIPTVIVPYRFVFADGGIVDATADVIDGATQIEGMLASPIFSNYPFMAGTTPLGNTQFGDAYMRGNFWALHGGQNSNYHVRLQVAGVLPSPLEIHVPAALGFSVTLGNGQTLGVIEYDTLINLAQAVMAALQIPPSALTIHATGQLVTTGAVAFAGVHNSADLSAATGVPGVHTYIMASWFSSAVGSPNTEVLAHEVVEWLMDPIATNVVPTWSDPVRRNLCAFPLLEVADPLEHFPSQAVVLNNRSFALPDVAFLPWFARTPPKDTVNGWFSMGNNLTSYTEKCRFSQYIATFYFPNDVGMTEARLTSFNNRKQATGYFVQFGSLVSFVLGNVDPFGSDPITFDVVNVPGSLATYAVKINDSGQIVGIYFDGEGREHGFLMSNGQYTTIDVPGAVATEALALDNKNNLTIAGDYVDAAGVVHGFTMTGGIYRRVDVPNAQGTAITGINDAIQIVGKFQQGTHIRGFVGNPGTTSPFDFTGDPQLTTLPEGINNAGQVAGTYVEQGRVGGFLFVVDDFVPVSLHVINDINDQAWVAGTLVLPGGPVAAFGVPVSTFGGPVSKPAGAVALPVGTFRQR